MENSFAKYIIANLFGDGGAWMDINLRERFLKEMFYKKDLSMFESDLIEIIKKVPKKLHYCVNAIMANVTCPPNVLKFVAEKDFAKIKKGRNFIFEFCYGSYDVSSNSVEISLFDIIDNANDEFLEKIFVEIENMPISCLGQDQKNKLLQRMVGREKTVSLNLLKRLLKSKHAEVSALAETRLEKMGIHTEDKANELAHYKSLNLGVLCKQHTWGKGYSNVKVKEMTPNTENIFGTVLNEDVRLQETILGIKTVFVKEEKGYSFFTITATTQKNLFVKQWSYPKEYLIVVDIDRKPLLRTLWTNGDLCLEIV